MTNSAKYPSVYIFHEICGGYWFWAVDMPGAKRDIKDALYRAAQSGDRVVTMPPGERIAPGQHCKCPWPTEVTP